MRFAILLFTLFLTISSQAEIIGHWKDAGLVRYGAEHPSTIGVKITQLSKSEVKVFLDISFNDGSYSWSDEIIYNTSGGSVTNLNTKTGEARTVGLSSSNYLLTEKVETRYGHGDRKASFHIEIFNDGSAQINGHYNFTWRFSGHLQPVRKN